MMRALIRVSITRAASPSASGDTPAMVSPTTGKLRDRSLSFW